MEPLVSLSSPGGLFIQLPGPVIEHIQGPLAGALPILVETPGCIVEFLVDPLQVLLISQLGFLGAHVVESPRPNEVVGDRGGRGLRLALHKPPQCRHDDPARENSNRNFPPRCLVRAKVTRGRDPKARAHQEKENLQPNGEKPENIHQDAFPEEAKSLVRFRAQPLELSQQLIFLQRGVGRRDLPPRRQQPSKSPVAAKRGAGGMFQSPGILAALFESVVEFLAHAGGRGQVRLPLPLHPERAFLHLVFGPSLLLPDVLQRPFSGGEMGLVDPALALFELCLGLGLLGLQRGLRAGNGLGRLRCMRVDRRFAGPGCHGRSGAKIHGQPLLPGGKLMNGGPELVQERQHLVCAGVVTHSLS